MKLAAPVIARLPRRGDSEYYAAIVTAFNDHSQRATVYVLPPNGKCFTLPDVLRDDLVDRGVYPLANSWMLEAPAE